MEFARLDDWKVVAARGWAALTLSRETLIRSFSAANLVYRGSADHAPGAVRFGRPGSIGIPDADARVDWRGFDAEVPRVEQRRSEIGRLKEPYPVDLDDAGAGAGNEPQLN